MGAAVSHLSNEGAVARIDVDGKIYQLNPKRTVSRVISEEFLAEPANLARALNDHEGSIAALQRRRSATFTDFEDIPLGTLGETVALNHGYGSRVRWWLVDWESAGTTAPIVKRDSTTDESTLVLASYVAGTATIRVELAG